MKLQKYLSLALMAMIGLGFTACDGKDDPTYEGGIVPGDNQRVYFASASKAIVVGNDDTFFTGTIYRPEENSSNELTVQLQATDASGLFTVPSTATFAAGAVSADFNVNFTGSALTGNTPYPVVITIDNANANEYGISTCTYTVTRDEYTEWAVWGYEAGTAKTGIGVYQLGVAFSGSFVCRVLYRTNPGNADDIQYRIEFPEDETLEDYDGYDGWYTHLELSTTDGGKTLVIPGQECVWGYYQNPGDLYIYGAEQFNSERYDTSGSLDEVQGIFALNLLYYVPSAGGGWGPGYEYVKLPGFADTHEYYLDVKDAGAVEIDGVNYNVIAFNVDETLDEVKYTVVSGEVDEESTATIVEGINSDNEAYQIETLTATKNVPMKFEKSGEYSIVAVGYREGEQKITSTLTFTYTALDPMAGWAVVAEKASYTDGVLPVIFGMDELKATFPVSVYENEEAAGDFRIPNLYSEYYPNAEEIGLPLTGSFSAIEIDAANTDYVYMPYCTTGLSNNGTEIELCTYAYYLMMNGYTADQIPADMWGKQEGNVITINATGVAQQTSMLMFIGDSGYYCDGSLEVDLAGGASAEAPARKAVKMTINSLTPAKDLKRPIARAHFSTKEPAKALRGGKRAR